MDDQACSALFKAAITARSNAYAPYSNFPVSAAVFTRGGTIYTGVNVENASYAVSLCAERAALAAAVTAGERDIEAIAICGGAAPLYPCGVCRQMLSEFGDMDVYCMSAEGEWERTRLSRLLPQAFGRSFLNQ